MSENDNKEHESLGDIGSQRVARIYAEALLNAAEKQGEAGETFEELDSFVHEVLAAQPEFEVFLSGAAAGRNARSTVLQHILDGRASDLFLNFLMVLNDNDRLSLLRPICAAYRELYDQRSGRVRVLVRSAVTLPPDQKDRLAQRLREKFHLEPILENVVDSAVLGGLAVRIGDMLYDSTVRTQLENIRSQIIARSSHEIQSERDRFCTANGN